MKSKELASIIVRAREAQKAWALLPYGKRSAHLKKAASYLAAHVDDISETIHRENGKLPLDALAAELVPAVMALGYYRRMGRRFLAETPAGMGSLLMFNKRSSLVYKPWGVVGIISPWNYPFAIPFSEVVMALLAGNAVLLKTASLTPGVGRSLEVLFGAAELPEGLFTYVELPGREAGPAFIGSAAAPGVDKLFFTGSTATGRELMALAAPRLLPLVLELGGADAAIVREDAALDRAAGGLVWAAFSNAGQSCGGVQRIIVHRKVYDAFLEKFCALIRGLRQGIDLGPMASLKQKQTVCRQIEACLAKGAQIAAKSEGAFFQDAAAAAAPALALTGVTPDMPVMNEEIFGPVAAVIPASDDEEALRIANASAYGLTGSVWSRNRRRARQLAARINAGAVMINDHLMSHGLAETPWGGFGDSGLGRTHGEAGFKEMVKVQVVVDDILPAVRRNIFWHPYSEKVSAGLKALIRALTGGPGRRLAALPEVLRIFLRYWEK
ncbi:MAG: aldehyde dehydrogenase family protein [Spirochaetaceae bacterium]|jgi:succinate-semialdehyde dehydrogenase/glutarate-semialdehyde dehydrogenase|nr:aldehyde dehydrogenase family protein [Spirochaetaceae bacterium]